MRSFAVGMVMIGWALVGCGSSGDDGAAPAADAGIFVDAGSLLDPPPSGDGFQLSTVAFTVPPGAERQVCYFVEVPYDTDVYVDRITLAQEPGSHHLNVFRVNTVKALGGVPGDIVADGECWKSANWSDWPLVANSQNSNPGTNVNDWQLPAGVAHKLRARELLMVQSHYVNATTQSTPGVGHAQVNFWTTDAASVTDELGTVFATNQNVKACPGDRDRSYTTTCRFTQSTPVHLVAANGHFHSRGKRFSIAPWDATTNQTGAPFYESQRWDDPPFTKDIDVDVTAPGGISYTCEYDVPATACGDPQNSCCFTFGGHVETQEHCNAFVYYYPKAANAAGDINCF